MINLFNLIGLALLLARIIGMLNVNGGKLYVSHSLLLECFDESFQNLSALLMIVEQTFGKCCQLRYLFNLHPTKAEIINKCIAMELMINWHTLSIIHGAWRVLVNSNMYLYRVYLNLYSHRFPANYTFQVEPSAMIRRISLRHPVFHRL